MSRRIYGIAKATCFICEKEFWYSQNLTPISLYHYCDDCLDDDNKEQHRGIRRYNCFYCEKLFWTIRSFDIDFKPKCEDCEAACMSIETLMTQSTKSGVLQYIDEMVLPVAYAGIWVTRPASRLTTSVDGPTT